MGTIVGYYDMFCLSLLVLDLPMHNRIVSLITALSYFLAFSKPIVWRSCD